MQHLFLIGPGGAGKTTCGRIVSLISNIPFVDLDSEFMIQIGNIDSHIDNLGYEDYYKKNSELFNQLLFEKSSPSIFALSSGFLAYPDERIVEKNKHLIRMNGISICLMPSSDFSECVSIILDRQLNRGLNLNAMNQKVRIEKRFYIYKNAGDFQVFSKKSPEVISNMIFEIIKKPFSLE